MTQPEKSDREALGNLALALVIVGILSGQPVGGGLLILIGAAIGIYSIGGVRE